jgi:hypothetical protein
MIWGLLFGVILILWGLAHITEIIFNIRIPIFGIIFGLFLLYAGVEIITGFSHWHKNCPTGNGKSCNCYDTCMGTSNILIEQERLNQQKSTSYYSTFMGKSFINLNDLKPEFIRATGTQLTMHIDTVMGITDILLNKQIPTRIIAKSCCSKVITPDDCTMIFGAHTFNSHVGAEPVIIIYTSTILGKTKIAFEN